MAEKSRKLELLGVVTSDKMDKTVVVTVEHLEKHPVFEKYIRRRARFKAHDERNECRQVDNTDWQVSLEGAFNFLDVAGQFQTLSGGNYVVVPITGSSGRVEERRAEATLVHSRTLTDNLSVQASLGTEYSELVQTGANGLTREFVRPKGFVALSWNSRADWDATFKVERAVGQLDFNSFVTTVTLNSDQGQTTTGNPNLVPEQSWKTELIFNGRTAWSGPVMARLYYRAIEDVNDQILVQRTVNPDGSIDILEADGNLDSATDFGIELVNGIKRVAVCSNPTTNLIRMDIGDNRINLTAQDIDFSVSANETITCSYDGEPISIGFKSTFLVEILSNMDTPTVVVELADSTRAGVFKPVYDDKQTSATLMLLMPMMINA